MNEVDKILGVNNNSNTRNTNYSTNRNYNSVNKQPNSWKEKKNNWKEQQNQDRQEIYNTMDKMAKVVGNDSQKFIQYLDIQSRFSKHSVGNCLVILDKAPDSTRIKDESSWNEIGIELLDNAKSIKILEPVNAGGKIYYNPKEVYDITQTNAPKEENKMEYGVRRLLEAIVNTCEVPRKAVDKLSNGELGSEYNKEENILYVCKGMDKQLLFQTMFQEIGNIEMKNDENSDIKSFRSYCISYMLCRKYGIDVSNFNFSNLPKEITEKKESKAIRGELNIIKRNFENIDSKLGQYFEMSNKEKKKTIPER